MPITLAQEAVDRFVELGRTEGLASGLRAILAEGLPVPRSATGLTLVPDDDDGADATAAPHALAEAAGLRLTRLAPSSELSQGPSHEAGPHSTDTDTDTYMAVLLAAVRLGLTTRLLDAAVEHLSARKVDGAPLTDKQLMQGAIAEAAASLELCRRGLGTAATPATAETLHMRLAETGWSIVTLFGASSYLRNHVALDFYAAELVHDAWVAPIGAMAG